MRTPFEDVRRLIKKCKCTIVLGLPQIFLEAGAVKEDPVKSPISLAAEWNQIETTMSIMLDLPTLVLLHNTVAPRGVFERGAANVFVYDFNVLDPAWLNALRPALASLKESIDA